MLTIDYQFAQFIQRAVAFNPILAFLLEGGLEDALEEFAGVLEVAFGVGGGGRDALKRFIQYPYNPLLLGESWKWNL